MVVQDAQSAYVAHSLSRCIHNLAFLIDARELQQTTQDRVQKGPKKSSDATEGDDWPLWWANQKHFGLNRVTNGDEIAKADEQTAEQTHRDAEQRNPTIGTARHSAPGDDRNWIALRQHGS